MRILILGAGATGGYFGARLAESGADVTFLVRPKRAARLAETGLRVTSQFGDCTIKPVKYIEKAEAPFDLILLSCKAYDLDSAMNVIAPAVGEGTTILPLLNGMTHIDLLQVKFGESVIGGFCIISSTLDSDGTIRHLNDAHTMKYGELSGSMSERIKAIDAVMQPANFTSQASENIVNDMWEKWVMISSLAAITTLMRATVGEVASAPYGDKIATNLFAECLAVARANGFAPRDAFVKSAGTRLVDRSSTLAASMLRDMQSGNRIEADHIIGALIDKAKEKSVDTPILEIAYCNLKAHEQKTLASSVSGFAAVSSTTAD
jgi:2-dehydropantoate 2-reductase